MPVGARRGRLHAYYCTMCVPVFFGGNNVVGRKLIVEASRRVGNGVSVELPSFLRTVEPLRSNGELPAYKISTALIFHQVQQLRAGCAAMARKIL